ncbi:MAG: hypothetical protein ACYTXA_20680 [Nostoc sp.]
MNFKKGIGVDIHTFKLPKASLIILSQKRPGYDERYLTHVVELVNEGSKDKNDRLNSPCAIAPTPHF